MVYIFLSAVIHEPLSWIMNAGLSSVFPYVKGMLALAIISVLTSGGAVVDAQSLKIDPLTLEEA